MNKRPKNEKKSRKHECFFVCRMTLVVRELKRERENVDVCDGLPSGMDTANLTLCEEVGGTRQRKDYC